MLRIVHATSAERLAQVLTLFREYAAALEFSLEFQDFEAELATFPGAYAPPEGRLLLALVGDRAAGCVALRPLEPAVCEMKRLYVRPRFRASGAGRALAHAIVEEARRLGYERMRLDTVPSMVPAIALYRSMGFREIPPYRHNPIEGATFFERDLR